MIFILVPRFNILLLLLNFINPPLFILSILASSVSIPLLVITLKLSATKYMVCNPIPNPAVGLNHLGISDIFFLNILQSVLLIPTWLIRLNPLISMPIPKSIISNSTSPLSNVFKFIFIV